MRLAKIEETFFRGLMMASTAVILATLVLILGAVLVKGLPAMNLAMVTQAPRGGFYLGKEGGILQRHRRLALRDRRRHDHRRSSSRFRSCSISTCTRRRGLAS